MANVHVHRLTEPRVTHPSEYFMSAIAAVIGGVVFAAILEGAQSTLPWWPFPVAGLFIASLFVYAWLREIRKIRRNLRTHGRFLCFNCHYPLNGLPDRGECPECEHPFDRAANERGWKMWEEVLEGRAM